MATKNYKTSGGKRQFPPEWYAAQAARRKQRADAKSSSQAPTSSPSTKTPKPKAKKGKISAVSIETLKDGSSAIALTRPYGKSKRTTTYGSEHISKHSLARLERVLEHRRKAKTFKYRAWTGSAMGVGVDGAKYKRYTAK